MRTYGGVELGGTKCVCGIGAGPDDLRVRVIPTTTPDETLTEVIRFFLAERPLRALGVGCFGPVDLSPGSSTWGRIRSTPKPGWSGVDVAGRLEATVGVPVVFDTDVNAAALGEQRWGEGRAVSDFSYVTVGTGIGAGLVVNREILHGLTHPEFGHVNVPHDRLRDPFQGTCPYHGDCLEGLASGAALEARWGLPAQQLSEPEVWRLEAEYLAYGLIDLLYVSSPQRIILGGGVMKADGLLTAVQQRIIELVGGYIDTPRLRSAREPFVVRPALGDRAGVLGALALAQAADGLGAR